MNGDMITDVLEKLSKKTGREWTLGDVLGIAQKVAEGGEGKIDSLWRELSQMGLEITDEMKEKVKELHVEQTPLLKGDDAAETLEQQVSEDERQAEQHQAEHQAERQAEHQAEPLIIKEASQYSAPAQKPVPEKKRRSNKKPLSGKKRAAKKTRLSKKTRISRTGKGKYKQKATTKSKKAAKQPYVR